MKTKEIRLKLVEALKAISDAAASSDHCEKSACCGDAERIVCEVLNDLEQLEKEKEGAK